MPRFEAHQPAPPSSSPPVGESSFVTCHVSKLTNSLLPLPPLQPVSLYWFHPTFLSSSTRPSLSSPPVWKSLFMLCHFSMLSNLLSFLPLFLRLRSYFL